MKLPFYVKPNTMPGRNQTPGLTIEQTPPDTTETRGWIKVDDAALNTPDFLDHLGLNNFTKRDRLHALLRIYIAWFSCVPAPAKLQNALGEITQMITPPRPTGIPGDEWATPATDAAASPGKDEATRPKLTAFQLANMQQFSSDPYPAPSSAVSNEQTVVLEKLASESRIRMWLHFVQKWHDKL